MFARSLSSAGTSLRKELMDISFQQFGEQVEPARACARSLHGRFFADAAGKLRLVSGAPAFDSLLDCFTQFRREPLEATAVGEPTQFGLTDDGLLDPSVLEDIGVALDHWE